MARLANLTRHLRDVPRCIIKGGGSAAPVPFHFVVTRSGCLSSGTRRHFGKLKINRPLPPIYIIIAAASTGLQQEEKVVGAADTCSNNFTLNCVLFTFGDRYVGQTTDGANFALTN